MQTLIFEGVVTALSSISHNGGERNGITTQLRREKFVNTNGKVYEVPTISGNSIRGILRDKGMFDMCSKLGYGTDEKEGIIKGLPLQAFYFLFSGGALVSSGGSSLDVGYFRKLKSLIPLVSIFGGAMGNSIMPGKIKVGKLIPICKETQHIIPSRYLPEQVSTIWDYCQIEMFTRKDDAKNDKYLPIITKKELASKEKQMDIFGGAKNEEEIETIEKPQNPQQMMYNIETLSAGTKFFWEIVLEDVTNIELEAFLSALLQFQKTPYLGGKSATGHGKISVEFDNWIKIDSREKLDGTSVDVRLGQNYANHLQEKAKEIKDFLESIK